MVPAARFSNDGEQKRSKMSDPLATYLRDHLAGSVHAIELVEAIRDQHSDQPLARFATIRKSAFGAEL
jgi:hypothetical protein